MFTCMLSYQMGILIYDQISILRNYLKVKLCHVVSLGFGLKGVKIAQIIANVGVSLKFCLKEGKITLKITKFDIHSYLPNGHLNLSCETSKVKLHHVVSLSFVLKEGKIALNITEFFMHSCLPNGHLNLRSNLIPRN